jgi:hypothetical protein
MGGARAAALAASDDIGRPGAWPRGSIIGNEKPGVSVFFVPDYEVLYYLALGMTEHAKLASDPVAAAELWRKTEKLWSGYVSGAELWGEKHKDRQDRWLPRARVHLAKAERERLAAEKRAHTR